MRRLALIVCLAGGLAGCAARGAAPPPASEVEFLTAGGSPELPFTPAVRVGRLLFLSGQLGTDADNRLVPGGIGPETRQALENIRAVLERNGSGMDRVVKCTVMLADMQEWAAMNAVYVTFFPAHRPARSAFGTAGLALGARTEIECVAVVR